LRTQRQSMSLASLASGNTGMPSRTSIGVMSGVSPMWLAPAISQNRNVGESGWRTGTLCIVSLSLLSTRTGTRPRSLMAELPP